MRYKCGLDASSAWYGPEVDCWEKGNELLVHQYNETNVMHFSFTVARLQFHCNRATAN
jgi:hypothetical protein